MSAGNFLGTIFVGLMFTTMWVVLSAAITKVAKVFNHTITILPSFQDAVTGFAITQWIWVILTAIVWGMLLFNYYQNESNEAGGWV
jgi:type II secretory pathway component PulF